MKHFEIQVVALVVSILLGCSSGGPSQTSAPENPNETEDPAEDPSDDPKQDMNEKKDSTTETVDGEGATLTTSDGTSLVIPAGALEGDVEISIAPAKADDLVAVPSGTELRGVPKIFTPHGTVFSTPVTITLPYMGTANSVLRLDDEEDTTWEEVSGVMFSDSKASFQTSSFSVYAVAYVTPPVSEAQKVGPDGGEVTFGSVKVSVPEGALSTTIDVSVKDIAADTLSATLPNDTTILGDAFGILPYATTFSSAVTVSLPYTGDANVVMALDDENDTTWEEVDATFDSGVASFSTARFGIFAVGDRSDSAPICEAPSEAAPTGTADASGGNGPYTWSAVDAVASFESWDGDDRYHSALTITLTSFTNACALQEAGYLVPDQSVFILHVMGVSPDARPGLPEPGTYEYADTVDWDTENTYFTYASDAAAIKTEQGCNYGGAPQPPETPSGSVTLTVVSETEVQGSFTYSDGFGGEHSGTFTAPICSEKQHDSIWSCCYEQ